MINSDNQSSMSATRGWASHIIKQASVIIFLWSLRSRVPIYENLNAKKGRVLKLELSDSIKLLRAQLKLSNKEKKPQLFQSFHQWSE